MEVEIVFTDYNFKVEAQFADSFDIQNIYLNIELELTSFVYQKVCKVEDKVNKVVFSIKIIKYYEIT